eukprot:2440690-Pleurochrysis_carterae.AAC.1
MRKGSPCRPTRGARQRPWGRDNGAGRRRSGRPCRARVCASEGAQRGSRGCEREGARRAERRGGRRRASGDAVGRC